LTKTLREKTINGVFWSALEKYGNQVIRFIISIILARLLEPREFGIVGMLAIFMGISQVFVDSGLSSALIQKKNPSNKDFCTVFYFNLLISILLYLILYFSSGLISSFYNEPVLKNITKVLGLVLIINAFGLIHNTKIQKSLDFKQITKVSYVSSVVSGSVAILLAYRDFGVWSLVFYQISTRLTRTIMLWILDHWKPSMDFSLEAFKELFNYSSKLLGSSLINSITINMYNLVIGKYFSAVSLGFYDRAKKLQMLVASNLNATIQVVTFPVLSEIQDEQIRLQKSYRKILEIVAFIIFPLMFMLIIVAKPLIIILLGEKWTETIVYFQILALVGIGYPIGAINLNILKVKGRTNL